MVLKKYSSDYIIKKSEKRLTIMIIYNKNTFFINNGYKKVQTINSQRILRFKKRKKKIIISDFLLLQLKLIFFYLFNNKKKLS